MPHSIAMVLLVVVAVGFLVVVLMVMSRGGDYRVRRFYRFFYSAWAFELILFGWRHLGRAGAYVITRIIGLGYAFTHPSTIRAVRANVALLDPEKATLRTACRLFVNLSECFSSYGLLATRKPDDVMEMLGKREGLEHLQEVHREGKGCLLVTGHLGFFELGGLVMTRLGFPMTALTLPEPTSELTDWRARFRARWGVRTIVVGGGDFSVVNVVRAINEGSFVASLIDRPYDGVGISVELPHGRILFSSAPVLIALLAQCPIIPVGIIKQADGKYGIKALKPIRPRWIEAGKMQTLEKFTKEIAEGLVSMFREAPDQWYHFSPLAR